MAKTVKKIQTEIEGMKPTKKNIETFSKKEVKEAEAWLATRTNGTPKELRTTITVGDLCQWKKSGTMYCPWYQRGEVWDLHLKRELITSLVNEVHIPDMVFAEKHGKYENIDGKQRIITIDEAVNNKFTLPTSIPEFLGGGQLFKDADERFKNWILTRPLGYTYLINPSDKQCQDTFIRLQQGMKLTPGEIIHGNYGHVAEYVAHVAQTHEINQALDRERFANYRTLNAMLLLESKYASSLGVSKELEFVNKGQAIKMFDTETETTFQKTLQRLVYCSGGNYMRSLSTLRGVTMYVWLRRNDKISQTKREGMKVNEFLSQYYQNNQEIKQYVKSHKNTVLNEDALSYYTVLVDVRQSLNNVKPYAIHLEEQYELFNKNRMNVYNAKEGNMCVNQEV